MSFKYDINNNYFDTIDNAHKAYWLGFIYADGYLSKTRNVFGIELNSIDVKHLEKFNKDIQSNRPIKIYNKNSTYGPQTNCRWTCANQQLYSSLIVHGIITTKSYDGRFPTIENTQYMADVVRGIFDGDGSITYRVGINNFVTANIGVCGTKNVLQTIEQFSGFDWSWSQRYPDKNIDNWQIHCGRQNDVIKFLDSIYKNADIFLDRKYQLYLDILENRQDYIGTFVPRYHIGSVRSNNSSGFTGVYWNKQMSKWQSYIEINKNKIHIGYFVDKNDAIVARLQAEAKYYGEFAPQKHLFNEYGILGGVNNSEKALEC